MDEPGAVEAAVEETKGYEVYLDAEFLVSGEDAAGIVNAAISKLEQLKGGPLSELERPTIAGVHPRVIESANVVGVWEATVRATIRRPAEFVVEPGASITAPNFDDLGGLPS